MNWICFWWVQNALFFIVSCLVYYFYSKYNPPLFGTKKREGNIEPEMIINERRKGNPIFEAIISWGDTQGWLFVLGLFLIVLFYSLDKEPIFTSILSYIGISVCG